MLFIIQEKLCQFFAIFNAWHCIIARGRSDYKELSPATLIVRMKIAQNGMDHPVRSTWNSSIKMTAARIAALFLA